MRPRLTALVASALVAAGLSACGRADEQAGDTGSTTLTVYASLPFQGASGPDAEATANGVRLALREAAGMVGDLTIKLVVLDDSTPKAGHWDPEQTAENARRAARDRTAIAYLGDGPSGATAISLPITNAAGVPQVSPQSGYAGLTTTLDADKGEPEKYYPAGARTFARPVPNDVVQTRALMAGLAEDRCRQVQLLEDRDVAGRGLATAVEDAAAVAQLEIVGRDVLRPDDDPAKVAAKVAARGADCVVFTGAQAAWVPPLFDALHAAAPDLALLAADGVASAEFAAALSPGTQERTRITAPPGVLEPTGGVRSFTRRYREVFGTDARSGALYGYEAMRLTLGAIRRAGPRGNDRTAVAKALFAQGERPSPLGRYRIEADGDTSSTRYTTLGVRAGRLVRLGTTAYAR